MSSPSRSKLATTTLVQVVLQKQSNEGYQSQVQELQSLTEDLPENWTIADISFTDPNAPSIPTASMRRGNGF